MKTDVFLAVNQRRNVILIVTTLLAWPLVKGNAQVTLQKWTEVYGTIDSVQLGKYVTGIEPSSNLPYRAAVSKLGNTGVYLLQTQTDTMVRKTFVGENLLLGDLNNDGWTDVVVGISVNDYDTVCVFWGTNTGIDSLNPLKIPGEYRYDGLRAGCIGDINNDGKVDLVLLARNFPNLSSFGKGYVYLNPVTVTASQTIIGDSLNYFLGVAATIGDINNDGFNDLIVKGNMQKGPQPNRYDYVNIYWGLENNALNLQLGFQLRGYNLNGKGLACFDANGDGIDDLLWTNRDSSTSVYVHYGGGQLDTVPDLRLQNPGVANFGSLIVNAGDMNGDGYVDIVTSTGSLGGTITDGFVFVFSGGPNIDQRWDAGAVQQSDSRFGTSASTVGDINGDGLTDIIVGAPEYDFGRNKGYWGIFLGDSSIRVTSVEDAPSSPAIFALRDAYPNPFNPRTTIRYDLHQAANITLEVFAVTGQLIGTLIRQHQPAGTYEAVFDGSTYASGVYLYRLTVRTADQAIYTETKKLILIK